MGVKVRDLPTGSGIYYVFMYYKGRRKSKKIGKNKRLAIKIAQKIEARLILGEVGVMESKDIPLFGNYVKDYFNSYSKIKHKPSTKASYKSVLDVHILPKFKNKRLNEISRASVKAFLISKQSAGLSSNTVRIIRSYLSGIMTAALDDEFIKINPARDLGRFLRPAKRQKQISPFSSREQSKFESKIENEYPRHHAFFALMFRSGLRVGEAVALKIEDIDLTAEIIKVRRNIVRGIVGTTKTDRERSVPMSPALIDILKEHLNDRLSDIRRFKLNRFPDWLFFNSCGNPFRVSHLRVRVFNPLANKMGKKATIHDIRHSYATRRISSGHNIADVSKAMGHSSIRTTIDTYYQFMPDKNTDDLSVLDAKKRKLYANENKKTITDNA